jgi:AraC family transcriptional activator of pobA
MHTGIALEFNQAKTHTMKTASNNQFIGVLHDLRDLLPAAPGNGSDWTFRSCHNEGSLAQSFLSPNRRDFYKIMLITSGTGVLTIGVNTYYIETPTILFVHPNDIFSWKILSPEVSARFLLFKKPFVAGHPQLKAILDRFGLFQDKGKTVISLTEADLPAICQHFEKIAAEEKIEHPYRDETIQALIHLLIVESMRTAQFPEPDEVGQDYIHIHNFFRLLEKETAGINYLSPIRIKTAKEFANNLDMHPNYLNAVLKKYTGQNVSALISKRLLEESMNLLLHTNWSLQNISYAIGFADHPNFTLFFKRNTGLTPADYRRKFHKQGTESPVLRPVRSIELLPAERSA